MRPSAAFFSTSVKRETRMADSMEHLRDQKLSKGAMKLFEQLFPDNATGEANTFLAQASSQAGMFTKADVEAYIKAMKTSNAAAKLREAERADKRAKSKQIAMEKQSRAATKAFIEALAEDKPYYEKAHGAISTLCLEQELKLREKGELIKLKRSQREPKTFKSSGKLADLQELFEKKQKQAVGPDPTTYSSLDWERILVKVDPELGLERKAACATLVALLSAQGISSGTMQATFKETCKFMAVRELAKQMGINAFRKTDTGNKRSADAGSSTAFVTGAELGKKRSRAEDRGYDDLE